MSADRLCEAARVLRERAEAATPGPWEAMDYDDYPGDEGVALLGATQTVSGKHMIGYFHVLSREEQEANGAFSATVDPVFALAVADWLDVFVVNDLADASATVRLSALTVADAIVGAS